MHPKRAGELAGSRLVFVQGGKLGMRLVFLSLPIEIIKHANVCEARWVPSRPFKYEFAPLVIAMDGKTDFPKLKKTFCLVRRDAWTSKFSSKYRSRCDFLSDEVAQEILIRFSRAYRKAGDNLLATRYEQALPFLPRTIDKARRKTYRNLLAKAKTIPAAD